MRARILLALAWPALLFHQLWPWMWSRWTAEGSYFDHGPFVPLVAIVWGGVRVAQGRVRPGGPGWPGLGLALPAAFGLFVLGTRDVGFVGAVGWWLASASLLVALLGWTGVRSLAPCLLLLLFMIPWPLKLVDDLALPLKSAAITLGAALAPGEAARDGVSATILLPEGGSLLVGEVCSGLRGLIALLALAYLVAAATPGGLWRRLLVLVAAPPTAVLMNGLRIAVLILVAEERGLAAARPGGLVHDVSGVLVHLMGLAGLLLLSRLVAVRATAPVRPQAREQRGPRRRWALATAVLLAGGWLVARAPQAASPAPSLADAIARLPWMLVPPVGSGAPPLVGRDVPLDARVEALLRAEGSVSRTYGDPRDIHVCFVYGAGREAQIHAPEICYQGGGFVVLDKTELPFPDPFAEAPPTLHELHLQRGEERRLSWCWYRSGGRSSASYAAFTWRALWNPQKPQALFWVSCLVGEPGGRELARERLRWVLRELGPALEGILARL